MIARAMEMEEIEWISTKEAATILGVKSTQAVRQLAARNPEKLPMVNLGSELQPRWVLRRADVLAFQLTRENQN